MGKRFLTCLVAGILLSIACAFGQDTTYRDTTICKQVIEHKTKIVLQPVTINYDSSYQACYDSTMVFIKPPVTTELFGFYVAYDAFVLGDNASENAFLLRMKNLGVNMLNYYARAKLYSSSDRDKIASG